jgi:hypothetical protein
MSAARICWFPRQRTRLQIFVLLKLNGTICVKIETFGYIFLYSDIVMMRGIMVTQCADSVLHAPVAGSANSASLSVVK